MPRRTPEQKERERERLRYHERMTTDPEFRKRHRASTAKSTAKWAAKNPSYRSIAAKLRKGDGQSRIYFIQAQSGPIKIGWTCKKPEVRMIELQVGNFEQLTLLGQTLGSEVEEQAIHERFDHLRIRGEWFRPDPSLKSFISTFSSVPT